MSRLPTCRGVTHVVSSVWNHPSNEGQRVRRLARTVRLQGRYRLTGQPVLLPYGDHSYVLARADDGTSKQAAYYAVPDHLEMSTWRSVLCPGDRFVDVGANIGLYTLLALDCGAEVVAVEPAATTMRQLRANLLINDYEATVVQAALAAEPGCQLLVGPDRNRAALRFGAPGDDDEDEEPAGEWVEVRTLDDVIGDRPVRGLKIDVEGAERLVLEGGTAALADRRIALIQLEWNRASLSLLDETREPTAALLRDHGYELVRPDRTGALIPVSDIAFGPDMFARPRS